MKKKLVHMLYSASTIALLFVSMPPAVLAADAGTTAVPSAGPTEVSDEVQTTVTVESVDLPKRMLTVRNELGELQTLQVPETVKRLAEVKKGDHIVLRYRQALATQLVKPGEGSKVIESTESTNIAPPGSKPAAVRQQQTKATIKIQSVDPVKNTVVFVGPRGVTRTVAVQRPELQSKLKQLKPGDEVEVVYSEALAVAVEPAKPKP